MAKREATVEKVFLMESSPIGDADTRVRFWLSDTTSIEVYLKDGRLEIYGSGLGQLTIHPRVSNIVQIGVSR